MIMIPILHILGHGGILEQSKSFSYHYMVAWFIEIASYCSVNIYALITGLVFYGKKTKISNLMYLYLQVIFYTVIITAVYMVCHPKMVDIKILIKAIFPFAYNTYWYFSAYFCLFFFIPYLNGMVDNFSQKKMKNLILLSFIIFSILPTLFQYDFGGTIYGYSFLWLAILYTLGAYIKKYGVWSLTRNRKYILFYFCCAIITWMVKMIIELITKLLFGKSIEGNVLVSYTSPTIILCSVCLLLFFANFKCGDKMKKFISFFSPLSFGVYLLHEEPLIRESLINNRFADLLKYSPLIMIFGILISAIGIWLVGSLVDIIRFMIFEALKVRQLCNKIESKLK